MRNGFRRGRLCRSESGATALEYALIGALIGLGLVGALATTKGSLSAVFGVAASQMDPAASGYGSGSGSAGTAPVAKPIPSDPTWSSKTLKSYARSVSPTGAAVTNFTYTDGTHVGYTVAYTKPDGTVYPAQIRYTADNALTSDQVFIAGYTDASGAAHSPSYTVTSYFYPTTNPDLVNQWTVDANGNSVQTTIDYNSNGGVDRYQTGHGTGIPTGILNGVTDVAYFDAYGASLK